MLEKATTGSLSQVAMSEAEDGKDDGKPLDSSLGELLATMATTIANASHVSVVIASLNALASMLYAVPEDLFSGVALTYLQTCRVLKVL